jgi:5S rRNA maturation endonuclease (ribonuclease M5)
VTAAAHVDTAAVCREVDLLKLLPADAAPKRIGDAAWLARCSFHEDRTPSMRVARTGDGWAFFCYACGARGDAIRYVQDTRGLRFLDAVRAMTGGALPPAVERDLKPLKDRDAMPKGLAGRTPGKVVAEYDYFDETGVLLYQVLRYEPKSFRQRQPHVFGGWLWTMRGVRRVLYRLPELLEAPRDRTVYVCYSPDTEVLTPRGWVALPGLDPSAHVAQWDLADSRISFVQPRARQEFQFDGEMVRARARWCGLLVTPDHRQPVLGGTGLRKVVTAAAVGAQARLPVSGHIDGQGGPTIEQARLLTAWIADGVNEKRGSQVSWNLKKARKVERLRGLLSALGVRWTEHCYPSCPEWTSLRVRRADIASVLAFADRKMWPWDALGWGRSARAAILDEIGQWDGDESSGDARRYFTADKQSADVVCALAALTGWGAMVRVDRRPERDGARDQYVLNLKRREWRVLGKAPVREPYAGPVYCLTVDTGFLVVRRDGKVTISGNCEGEKDVEALRSIGRVATCNVGGAGPGKWLPAYSESLRGRKVLVVPDNDGPGEKHALAVKAALEGVAASVELWRLPSHVKDVHELLAKRQPATPETTTVKGTP